MMGLGRDMIFDLDEDYVRAVMQSAGVTYSLVPGHARPARIRSSMPDYPDDSWLAYHHDPVLKPPRATTKQTTELELVMLDWLPKLARYCRKRNMIYVARATCLWFPHRWQNDRPVLSDRRIGRILDCDHKTAKKWREDGFQAMAALLRGGG